MMIISKLIGKFVVRSRSIVIDVDDMVNVLTVLNSHRIYDVSIGNCGWAVQPDKWFIHFHATDNVWTKLRHELNIQRVWGNLDINDPGVYSTD